MASLVREVWNSTHDNIASKPFLSFLSLTHIAHTKLCKLLEFFAPVFAVLVDFCQNFWYLIL